MNQFLILIAILVGGGIIVNLLESKNKYVRKTSEIVFGTPVFLLFSGLATMLCLGAFVLLSGILFWVLDFIFDFLNLSSKFEYDVLSLFRSVLSFLFDDGAHFQRTFFILWAIILLIGFKGDWMKKKIAWIKEKILNQRKQTMYEPKEPQQEFPERNDGETVLDYFNRVDSMKNKDREKKQKLGTESQNNEEEFEVQVRLPRETYEPQKKPRKLAFIISAEHTAEEALEAFHKFQQTGKPVISLKKNNQPSQNYEK